MTFKESFICEVKICIVEMLQKILAPWLVSFNNKLTLVVIITARFLFRTFQKPPKRFTMHYLQWVFLVSDTETPCCGVIINVLADVALKIPEQAEQGHLSALNGL